MTVTKDVCRTVCAADAPLVMNSSCKPNVRVCVCERARSFACRQRGRSVVSSKTKWGQRYFFLRSFSQGQANKNGNCSLKPETSGHPWYVM